MYPQQVAPVGGKYTGVRLAGKRQEFAESACLPFTVTMEYSKVVGPAIIYKSGEFFAANMALEIPTHMVGITTLIIMGNMTENKAVREHGSSLKRFIEHFVWISSQKSSLP